jgi:hypothetical protein
MVVPVLITSCQVSENPKKGPEIAQTTTVPRASKGKHPGSTYFAGTDLRDFSEQLAEDPRVLGCPSAGGWWWGTVLSVWGSWHGQ